jgi:hypothetical protein
MPKQIDEQRFQMAVMCLALSRAKTAVRAQILANGLKIGHFPALSLTTSATNTSPRTWKHR